MKASKIQLVRKISRFLLPKLINQDQDKIFILKKLEIKNFKQVLLSSAVELIGQPLTPSWCPPICEMVYKTVKNESPKYLFFMFSAKYSCTDMENIVFLPRPVRRSKQIFRVVCSIKGQKQCSIATILVIIHHLTEFLKLGIGKFRTFLKNEH